jgi:hypothetical protein
MILAKTGDGSLLDACDASRGDVFACPSCGATPLTLKQGLINVAHYAHPPSVTCPYETEPESERHVAMKRAAAALTGGRLEVVVGKRRADVLVDGRYVVECQASAITLQEVAERCSDWNAAGYPVLWVWDLDRIRLHQDDEYRVPAPVLATARPSRFFETAVVYHAPTGRICGAALTYTRWKRTLRKRGFRGFVESRQLDPPEVFTTRRRRAEVPSLEVGTRLVTPTVLAPWR